jgi:peptidoglycan-associated lipoprotein
MRQRVIPILSVTILCLMLFANVWGCSKRVTSSSGDATSTVKEKSSPLVETINRDSIPTVPDDRRSTTETARAPVGAPLSSNGSAEPLSLTPSSLARMQPAGEPRRLSDIFFDFDEYTIRGDAQPFLEADAVWIKSASGKSILIEGHCDERGTEAYNLVLGEKRARSTKRYLEDLGVSASRMKIVSFGEIRPFCKEHDESCYQTNRRAHFVAQ